MPEHRAVTSGQTWDGDLGSDETMRELPGGMSEDNMVTVHTPHIDMTLNIIDVLC